MKDGGGESGRKVPSPVISPGKIDSRTSRSSICSSRPMFPGQEWNVETTAITLLVKTPEAVSEDHINPCAGCGPFLLGDTIGYYPRKLP